jgi:hypothetical protein
MSLKLENDLLLRAAELSVAEHSRKELLEALRYSWRLVLAERERHELFASDVLGVPVVCGGPLLPPRQRTPVP